jgi:hypothetical protein
MRELLRIVGVASTVVGLIAGVHAAAAHHSAAMFDKNKRVTVNGEVKEIRWTNPHVSISIYGASQDGEEASEWLLESRSPSVLSRLGWTRTTFKPGDRVQVELSPLIDSRAHGGDLKKIIAVDTGKSFAPNLIEQEDQQ